MEFESVIGLEVHAHLLTKSKLFCGCDTTFGAPPNSQTCPVCWGMPGVLPVLNRRAVEFAIRMACATHCTVRPRSIFARKNYFYPDLPKDYQISQYEEPLSENGWINIELDSGTKRIGITRIHMEEDAGKLMHSQGGKSFVDFNRCGVPLIEIVSEPDMREPAEAAAYLKVIRRILVYLEVCDGNMEQGSFRCDANVSVRLRGEKELGVKVELKNMNSFKFIEKALAYEIARQIDAVRTGGKIVQETRLWDTKKGMTHSMRGKEEAHDYRYFPEPDLLPLVVEKSWIAEIGRNLPELPEAKKARFIEQYRLPPSDADVLTDERPTADFFEETVKFHNNPKSISNWVMNEIMRKIKNANCTIDKCLITPQSLGELIKMIDDGITTRKIAKIVFEEMWSTGNNPSKIIEEKNLKPIYHHANLPVSIIGVKSESADIGFSVPIVENNLESYINSIIRENPEQLKKYLSGKTSLLQYFVGQVMKLTRGQADPKTLNNLITEKLELFKTQNAKQIGEPSMKISVQELKDKGEEYKNIEQRWGIYDLAVELVDNGYKLHGCLLMLAIWNANSLLYNLNQNTLIHFRDAIQTLEPKFAMLKNETFQTINFDYHKDIIGNIYNKLAKINGIKYTGASKVMHLINRNLFIMWDAYIRGKTPKRFYEGLKIPHYEIKKYSETSEGYIEFLKDMQKSFSHIEWKETKPLTKIIDEYNYISITIPIQKAKKHEEDEKKKNKKKENHPNS